VGNGFAAAAAAQRDAVLVLVDIGDFRPEADRGKRMSRQSLRQHVGQFPLLALKAKGVARFAGEQREIEVGDQTLLPVPLLSVGRHQAGADQLLGHAQAGQHVERRRMKG